MIILLIIFIPMAIYCIKSTNEHWRKVEDQAVLMAQSRAGEDDDRWTPISEVEQDDEEEEQDGVLFC